MLPMAFGWVKMRMHPANWFIPVPGGAVALHTAMYMALHFGMDGLGSWEAQRKVSGFL